MSRRSQTYDEGIEHHEKRIQNVFRWAHDHKGWTPVQDRTPLDVLIDEEPQVEYSDTAPESPWTWPSQDAEENIQLAALKAEEAADVAEWARKRLMQWICGEGLHPFKICQRVYAMCLARHPELVGPLNGHWLANILGLGRAAFSALMQRLFNIPVEAKTGKLLTVGGQKAAASRAKYAANAEKHKPRQKINSTGLSDEDADSDEIRRLEERREILRQQIARHEKQEHASNEEFFRGMRLNAQAALMAQDAESQSTHA